MTAVLAVVLRPCAEGLARPGVRARKRSDGLGGRVRDCLAGGALPARGGGTDGDDDVQRPARSRGQGLAQDVAVADVQLLTSESMRGGEYDRVVAVADRLRLVEPRPLSGSRQALAEIGEATGPKVLEVDECGV